ncbi:MAG: hypothetical protein K1X78_14520 [Verrucomicrobiaceae bacterium]|nr:hypothetical protein [Verrucomicrobiaceae bacterium]
MLRYLLLCFFAVSAHAESTIDILPDQIVRGVNLSRILGANAGLWYSPKQLKQVQNSDHLKNWRPGLIRIPGGSWGDELVWNGNGVRDGKTLDATKFVNGRWQIDFSAYQPGFRAGANGKLSDFHGNVDVKAMHEFVRDCGSSAIVTVNAGTGTREMAAEWVRWAKANNYAVSYWEIGNELEGQWEQGHFRPDGKEMTGEMYADIYLAFAKAMKAVDPTIKVGGPAASNDGVVFGAALLEKAANYVDFISYHTYPANSHAGTPKLFEEADSILAGVKKVRELIRQKAPQRADKIEIGITEWHVGIHEGPRTVNHISGPWSAKWIGRMIEAGVDFANVWDLFSQTAQGGHGIFGKDDALTPRGPFWALQLWSQHMSGKLVKCESKGITAFATDKAVLLINESETEPATTSIRIAGKPITGTHQAHELSAANYLWNEHANAPVWSHPPAQRTHTADAQGRIALPPLSATVFHLDQSSEPIAASIAAKPSLVLPVKQQADVPFTAWITLRDDKDLPFIGTPQEVQIETRGSLKTSTTKLTLHSAAAPLQVQPTGAGTGEIIVRTSAGESHHRIELVPVEFRPQVLWSFGKPDSLKDIESPHQLALHEGSAQITLAKTESNRLITFKSIPPCEKQRIGGLSLKLRATDLKAPSDAKLTIVCQSLANQWMPLGDIPLTKLTSEWSTHELKLPDIRFLEAVPDLRSIVVLIHAPDAAGTIFVDEVGVLTRH